MDITVACQDTQIPAAAVDGVLVRIYDVDGVVFITSGVTGSGDNDEGEVLLTLPSAGSYRAYFSMSEAGYQITSPQLLVVADEGDIFDVTVERFQNPVSGSAYLCTVSGYARSPDGVALRNIEFSFHPREVARTAGNYRVVPTPVRATTDRNGYLQADLVRGGSYDVYGPVPSRTGEGTGILVPDRGWVGFPDLMFPVPVSVTFDPSSLSGAAGEELFAEVSVLCSDGNTRDLEDVTTVLLEFTGSGLSATVVGSQVRIEGESVGSYTLVPGVAEDDQGKILPDLVVQGSLSVIIG